MSHSIPSAPVAPRPRVPAVEALLARMTRQEKVGQLSQLAYHAHHHEAALEAARTGTVGAFLNASGRELRNELQRLAVEQSRLGIPLVFGRDVIHGYRTIFPIPLGLGATFDPELVEATAAAAAAEAAEDGVDWTFAPMVDVARDPRWGRVAESPGEDPHHVSVMGAAMVRGFQGLDPAAPDRVAACAKHFVGYGAAEAGKDYNTTYIPEGQLHEVYLPPFRACLEAGVLSVMTAFNDLNGVPMTGNARLVRGLLKDTWGFPGLVVSDWASMTELMTHGVCRDEREVARVALEAGVDLEMATGSYRDHLAELVTSGAVPEPLLDDAVRRVLELKHRLGLFERPYVEAPAASVALSPRHRELARRAARRSVVLLKRGDALLPLGAGLRSVAVVGPLADAPREQLGCWAFDGAPEQSVTLLAALRERLGPHAALHHQPGLEHARDASTAGIAAAVAAAEAADVVIAALGENAELSGECRSRAFLGLPGAQLELLARVAATGKPLVVVVFAGRPLLLGPVLERATAVLYAWQPGTLGGPALVDLLFGDEAPSGRLPMTFPRAVGQIPIYHSHRSTGRPPRETFRGIPPGTPLDPVGYETSYLDLDVSPELPFGFGLSYTTFGYADLRLSPPRAPAGASIEVGVTVTNQGGFAADEVVQIYVRDRVASVTRPVRELKAFRRVHLAPGEARRVTVELGPHAFALAGPDGRWVVEPGAFQIFVGGDSMASLAAELELT